MKPSILLLVAMAFVLSGCATRNDNGCDSVACRPLSDSHHLTIWWPSDMRNGVQDYTQMPVR